MKKVLIPLTLLCLLAALMAPMVGCAKKEEPAAETAVEETPIDAGTEMGSGSESMGSEMETMGSGMDHMTSAAPAAQ